MGTKIKLIITLILITITSISYAQKIEITINFFNKGDGDTYTIRKKMLNKANEVFNPYDIYFVKAKENIFADVNVYLYDTEDLYYEEYDDTYAGLYSSGTMDIAIRTNYPLVVFCHELGHHLGIDHVNGDYLMNPTPVVFKISDKNKKKLYKYKQPQKCLIPPEEEEGIFKYEKEMMLDLEKYKKNKKHKDIWKDVKWE